MSNYEAVESVWYIVAAIFFVVIGVMISDYMNQKELERRIADNRKSEKEFRSTR